MRLLGTIHVYVAGSLVEREPTRWERLKRSLGSKLDLSTDRVKNELEATAAVDGVRRALQRQGVNNAITLVIDGTVIFQDQDGKKDDLGDLVVAFADHAGLFGQGFKELRFAAEHEESGLHLVIETVARSEHHMEEPAAIVSVGGRIKALEPRTGESADDYRARVEPLTKDTVAFEAARMQFQSFVTRLEEALRASIANGRVEEIRAEARVVKPSTKELQRQPVRDPAHPAYDPFMTYYPSPMGMMLDVMMISSFMHMMHPPHVFVTNPAGTPLGTAGEVAADPGRLEESNDPGGNDGDSDAVLASHDEEAGADDGGGFDDGGFDDGGGFDSGGGFDD